MHVWRVVTMTVATDAPDLRTLSLDDLEATFASADDGSELWRACLREGGRRDRQDRARKARANVREEWHDAAFSQYLAADRETRGNLLSRAGNAAGISDWPGLWTGSDARAMRYASEELREFWASNPRVTVSQFARQLRESRRVQRDLDDLAALDVNQPEPVQDQPEPIQSRPVPKWDRLNDGTRLRETWVKVNGERRSAWWRITPDGAASLHPSLTEAIPRLTQTDMRTLISATRTASQPHPVVQATPRHMCPLRAAQRLCPVQRRWRRAVTRHTCPPIPIPIGASK